MSLCDTSFIMRLVEFNRHNSVDPQNLVLTGEVIDELESKDFGQIVDDIERIRKLSIQKNLDLEVIARSNFKESINWIVDNSNYRSFNFNQKLKNCKDQSLLDLESGEQSCYFARNQNEIIMTEDFVAYNILYNKTGGNVACLIEVLANSKNLSDSDKDLIRALDSLFLPEEELDTNIWTVINNKIERSLDERVEVS